MMHGREKSDSGIVAGKPTNKAVSTAAEPVERRALLAGWLGWRAEQERKVVHPLRRGCRPPSLIKVLSTRVLPKP